MKTVIPFAAPAALMSIMAVLCGAPGVAASPLATPSADRSTWPEGTPPSDAGVELGRHLFFDPRLVLSGDQSCASCHSPYMGYADGVALDLAAHKGWKRANRNSPSLYNLSDAPVLHWDGRTPDGQCFTPEDTGGKVCLAPLESQAFKSMRSRKFHQGFLPSVQREPRYQEMFRRAFPPDGAITHVNMARAIAAFERSLISNDAPFDRFLTGDLTALTPEARRGLDLFQGKARCIACHNGAHFTDWQFHNIGVDSDDPGRGAKAATDAKKAEFMGAFKTPGLRNAALTAPYMHNGSIGTLEDVIAFYDRGGDRSDNLSPLIEPLGLTAQDRWDLVAFLNALTHTIEIRVPDVPGVR